MIKKEKELGLADLIDINFLQEFQDAFAKTMDIASLTLDHSGPVTKPSKFNDFCCKYTRNSPEGFKKCNECDIKWGKIAAEKGEPVIYTCHAGLTDFAVPIMLEGKHIGTILSGQVLDSPPNEDHFKAIARRLGIDEDEYITALRKIKVVDPETIKSAAQMLYIVANSISEIGNKNLNLYKKNNRENLYRMIVETIRNTLNIDETKKTIVDIVGKTLNADRCFIVEYDKVSDRFSSINGHYLSNAEAERYTGYNVNRDFPNFLNIAKTGKPIITNKNDILVNETYKHFEEEIKTFKEYDITSIFVSPLFYHGELLGLLSTHYEDENRKITEDEVNFITMISNQIAIAIHQAKLYQTTQLKVKREKIIGKLIAESMSTFDITQIKQIVKDVGIISNADRCYFIEFDSEGKKGKPISYEGEYLSSPEIKSIIGHQFPAEEGAMFVQMYNEAKGLVIFDYEEIEKTGDTKYEAMINYSKVFGLKNSVGIPLFFKDKLAAILAIEYVREKTIPSSDELDFFKILGNQTGMVYNQIKRYQNTKKLAEKERLLRKIGEAMRVSLDINDVKKTIVKEVGKALNADRCFIAEFNKKTDKFLKINDEYLSSDEIIPFSGTDPDIEVPTFAKLAKLRKPLIVNDFQIQNLDEETLAQLGELDFSLEQKALEKYQAFSIYTIPLFYHNEFLGAISINYTRQHFITEEEIDLVNIVADQISIALYQAGLYNTAQIQVKKEKLIGDILTKAISTFNISEVTKIVKDVGIITKADRCYFLEADIPGVKSKEVTADTEYLAFPEMKSIVGYEFYGRNVQEFSELLSKVKDLIIFDYEELKKTDDGKYKSIIEYADTFNLKSAVGIPFYALGKLVGVLCIEYSKEKVIPPVEDLEFLKILANQIGVAHNQILLYQNTKKTAERENLLRNIFAAMSSSFDLKKIKKQIVTEVGKALGADICFMLALNEKENEYFVDEYSEYRSSDKEKSFIGYNPRNTNSKFFSDILMQNKEVNYDNVEEFIIKNDLIGTPAEIFLKEYNIKSSYNIPIFYANKLLGCIVLEYTQNYKSLGEDGIEFLRIIAAQVGTALYHSYLYKKANESVRAKAEFIANMSHEIKTPLNIVIGFSEILSASQLDRQKQVDYLNNINKSGKHLLALTNDIINMSKIESGNIKINYQNLNSRDLIIEVVNSIELFAMDKKITIEIEAIDAEIDADKKMLTQILYNLLNNAIKFTPKFGRISIKSILDRENLIISVTDNGIGIASADQEKIFEEFKQLDSSYQRQQEGAGLGLAISKRLVELHNGNIYVESEKNKGSKFWFSLPTSIDNINKRLVKA